jgi:hypothetical protein
MFLDSDQESVGQLRWPYFFSSSRFCCSIFSCIRSIDSLSRRAEVTGSFAFFG